jgi:NADPH-dependent 2,4-dienoyl-CoA reductase/sulfur reductase-like enzyme
LSALPDGYYARYFTALRAQPFGYRCEAFAELGKAEHAIGSLDGVWMKDVLVIGGGNAALCAALVARQAGASVLLLESSPRDWRGGNTQHVRNLRCMHDAPQDVLVGAYTEE